MKLFFHVNCTEALEPEEVISSGESGPYAVNTILGWCGWGQYPVLVKMEIRSPAIVFQ